jgi:hypothetical protein
MQHLKGDDPWVDLKTSGRRFEERSKLIAKDKKLKYLMPDRIKDWKRKLDFGFSTILIVSLYSTRKSTTRSGKYFQKRSMN